MSNIIFRNCKHCGSKVHNRVAMYCSNRCQIDFQYYGFVKHWLNNEVPGGIGINAKDVSAHVKRYLIENYGQQCTICGWNRVHPTTKRVPLEIDHIDGNSDNNTASNLRMICPNCHALTENFRGLNKGKGRSWRRNKYLKVRPKD